MSTILVYYDTWEILGIKWMCAQQKGCRKGKEAGKNGKAEGVQTVIREPNWWVDYWLRAFPVCSDQYQWWSEEGSGVRGHGLLMHRGAEAGHGGAKKLKKLKLLLISAIGLTPLPPYEPGQGYFVLKGSFSCYCCLLRIRAWDSMMHLETFLIVEDANK